MEPGAVGRARHGDGALAQQISAVAAARSLDDLTVTTIGAARTLLGGCARAFQLFDGSAEDAVSFEVEGVPSQWIEAYRRFGRELDPLRPLVYARHFPVHDRQHFGDEEWNRYPFVAAARRRLGFRHYLLAPIVAEGAVTGTLHVIRNTREAPFDDGSVAAAAALCTHVSARLGVLRLLGSALVRPAGLSAREAEIASLVARGLGNRAIGSQLGISENTVKAALKQMFRKLAVPTRAALVARLTDRNRATSRRTWSGWPSSPRTK